MSWFDSKKVKEQQAEIDSLKQRLEIAESNRYTLTDIKAALNEMRGKIIPAPVITKNYTVSMVEFAKNVQRKYRKRKACGGGSACGWRYEIPCDEIDKIAKSNPINEAQKPI